MGISGLTVCEAMRDVAGQMKCGLPDHSEQEKAEQTAYGPMFEGGYDV